MITCKLVGRLGNQMNIMATTLSYALRHNTSWHIPAQSERPADWPCYFPNLTFGPIQTNNFFDYKEAANQAFAEIPYYPNIRIEGYFQSEKYFSDFRNTIINSFGIPWMQSRNTVSVHVRRGDYLDHPIRHPVITPEYLLSAIKYFVQKGYSNFIFFSDDLLWCRTFIDDKKIAIGIDVSPLRSISFSFSQESNTELHDLSAMSSCEHHIISNSSYAWWGAWLNKNPDKIVIAPKIWTGVPESEWDTKDICPSNWIRL